LALDVDRVRAAGVWYAISPIAARSGGRSEPPPDGRWQRGSAVAGFYLADSRDSPADLGAQLLAEGGRGFLRPGTRRGGQAGRRLGSDVRAMAAGGWRGAAL